MIAPHVPNKSLGQHWLHDQFSLQSIADSASVGKDDTVLEIGPGLGTLTKILCAQAKQVIAVEFDESLAKGLAARVNMPNLRVVHSDILKYDLSQLPAGYKVAANVPYYITSKIVQLLSEAQNPPSVAVLLVQKEVAHRLAAQPGQMSVMTVAAQLYNQVSLGIEVPAYLFTPPPKVDSQVVVLQRRPNLLFEDCDYKKLFRVVKAGFGERRKKLRSSLSGGLGIGKDLIDATLLNLGIPADARAQELTLQQWYDLQKALLGVAGNSPQLERK